ncbi:N-acetylgalactosamine-6-sulfatase [Haloferula helveola]|uniref:N-acetylgalactosamine-6-sulfatase n=1 Tax=Haloferula helveola TaxID=490095 RepID=A0ABM7R9I0_9BACT|nr:N-acetylgalactosamine-6-sulfatase [Haloferula helveola]
MIHRLFLLAALLLPGLLHAEDKRPNIVLILSDDHTYSHYGFMGNEMVETPNLDRMAGESLLYTRGYSMPVCSPSLATLLTGLLPSRHGITGNDLHASSPKAPKAGRANRDPLRDRLLANPLILPKTLSDAGYLTFQTGKLWNTSFSEVGFTHGMTKERSRHGGAGLSIGRKGMEPVHEFIDMAVEKEKPFFVWYAPLLPHDPHNPPERLKKKYAGKGPTKHGEVYHAMIEWFDETCGDLDRYLEKKGLKDDTFIIYLSDNGWDPFAGYGGGRAKLTPYENGIRTPVFIRWPGKVQPTRDDSNLVSIVDVVPTLLSVAGISVPDVMPGLDLRDHEAVEERDTIFIESFRHDIMDIDDPSKSVTSLVVLDGWSKLILPGTVGPDANKARFSSTAGVVELFDLKSDPTETKNLAAERPAEVKRLKALQDAQWKVE